MVTLKIIASLCIGFLCLCCCFLSPNPWAPHHFLLRDSTSFTDTTAAFHPFLLFLSSSNAWACWHVNVSLSLQWSRTVPQNSQLKTVLFWWSPQKLYDVWSMFVYFCTDILENKEIIYLFIYACFRRQQYFFVFCSSEKESYVAQTGFELSI